MPGIDAAMFQKDPNAIEAFKESVAATMPGVYPDEVTFNLITSLRTEVEGSRKLEEDSQDKLDGHLDSRQLVQYSPSGIGINYNVTLNIERFGFYDAALCFQTLQGQLNTAIANGNFTTFIQQNSLAFGTPLFTNATSGSSDYVVREFVYVGQGINTQPPTSMPSSAPTHPSSMPTSQPTHSPLPNWFVHPRYFEMIGGLVIAIVVFSAWYVTTVLMGVARVDANPTSMLSKGKEASVKMANPDIQEEKYWHD